MRKSMEERKIRMTERTRAVLCGLMGCMFLLTACAKAPTETVPEAETSVPASAEAAETVKPEPSAAVESTSTETLPEAQ